MRSFLLAAAIAAAAVASPARPAAAVEQIFILSSPATLPFTKAVAMRATRAAGGPPPVVEMADSTVALRYLCGIAETERPHAVSVARRMRRSELDACARNGVAQVVEVPVGLDLVVFAQSRAAPPLRLTLAQLYLGLALQFPDQYGEIAPNPHLKWSEIDPALPDTQIDVRVLQKFSDTREALQETLLSKGAQAVPRFARLWPRNRPPPRTVWEMRTEEPLVVTHMSEEVIARELIAHPAAVGVFSYRFLEANKSRLRGVPLNGAEPTPENAYAGKYPATRALYLYLRSSGIGTVPGLSRLGTEFVSGEALGPGGYLLALGFVPLDMADMLDAMTQAHTLSPVRRDVLPE
jgi:phosphate transport system substrate-binding protein